jgi:hypothetical protein
VYWKTLLFHQIQKRVECCVIWMYRHDPTRTHPGKIPSIFQRTTVTFNSETESDDDNRPLTQLCSGNRNRLNEIRHEQIHTTQGPEPHTQQHPRCAMETKKKKKKKKKKRRRKIRNSSVSEQGAKDKIADTSLHFQARLQAQASGSSSSSCGRAAGILKAE